MAPRPRVIVHNAVSIDGKLDWLTPAQPQYDRILGVYYEKAAVFQEEASLVGAGTALKALEWSDAPREDSGEAVPEPAPGDSRPLLVIPDSRGRIRSWRWWLSMPFWRAGVALCSRSTPAEHFSYLEHAGVALIVAGENEVDLGLALRELRSRFDVGVVRTDSGGTLNGLLLAQGLVDEVSVLLVPVVAGPAATVPLFSFPADLSSHALFALRLCMTEQLDDGIIWLRYEVPHGPDSQA